MRIYDHISIPRDWEEVSTPVIPCYFSYSDNLPTWSYAMHNHPGIYEFSFATKGSGVLKLETNKEAWKAGDIVIMPPTVLHSYRAPDADPMCYYSLHFRITEGAAGSGSYLNQIQTAPVIIHADSYLKYNLESLKLLHEVLQMNCGQINGLTYSICMSLYYLGETLLKNRSMTLSLKGDSYAHDILLYITQHYSERITLESLSRQFHISPSHLGKIFRDTYHISPINYLIHCRITQAVEFLLKTELSVDQISQAVGYDNPNHFSHLFAARIGCTPSEFRAQHS